MITVLLISAVVLLIAVLVVLLLLLVSSGGKSKASDRRMEDLEAIHAERERRIEEAGRRLEEAQSRLEEKTSELGRVSALQFKNLASELLRESTESLRHTNSEQLDAVLTPLKEKLDVFSKAVNDTYVKENATRKSLSDQIDRLMRLNMTIGDETRNLSSALKGNSKVQGQWGEMVLESLLEGAGMIKGVNFFVQMGSEMGGGAISGEDGKRLRPDVVVLLPDDHRIVIDSKVSLTAYLEYVGASPGPERQRAARRHIDSVRRHVDELASRSYGSFVKNAAEHVLMFIPNEGAYFAANEIDHDIWKYAYDRNVVIVSPTHIFSVMQIISQLWRQENQNRNAAEIARLGGLMYDKFVAFTAELDNISRQLKGVESAYEKCRRHLTEGGTSLVRRAERMRELGAKASKRLNPTLVEQVSDDESGSSDVKDIVG